jgi:murein L,D-transpeptidase YcbB/YkuD
VSAELPTRRRAGPCLLAVALSTLLVAACGSDGETGRTAAEARVALKEKAVATARSAADTATAAFCDASSSYVTAIDRYGDVLTATAPTVGDVQAAGADLTDPRAEALNSAEAVTTAREELATAEQELAEAQAALAAKVTSGPEQSGSTAEPSVASPAPLVPSATAARVRQADEEFTTAQEGITATTPLAAASEQFNAAAVALEMAWLRVFADAGCLTDEQQKQAEKAVREYTLALQESLAAAGYYDGDVDGVYGPATVDAVETLQKQNGLPVTGTVDKATEAALQAQLDAKGGAAAARAVASTAAVQQTLALAGYWDGPVDGDWTPALTQALTEFQEALGVEPTGTVDAATVAALEKALGELALDESESEPATPSPEPSSSTPVASATTTPA